MSQCKYNITIESAHDGFYKIDLLDHHGSKTTVYEPTIGDVINYAKKWCLNAEERKLKRDTHARAVKDMIALDRIAGITTNTSDGLD